MIANSHFETDGFQLATGVKMRPNPTRTTTGLDPVRRVCTPEPTAAARMVRSRRCVKRRRMVAVAGKTGADATSLPRVACPTKMAPPERPSKAKVKGG